MAQAVKTHPRSARCAALLAAALVGCGGDAIPQVRSDHPTPATVSPSPPDGWVQFTDDAGAVSVWLPRDFDRILGIEDMSAHAVDLRAGRSVEIHAARRREPQPRGAYTDEVLARWLTQQLTTWVGPREITNVGMRRVALPAGEATELTGDVRVGSVEVLRVVGYAIPSAGGVASLLIIAPPELATARSDELALIPQLLRLKETGP